MIPAKYSRKWLIVFVIYSIVIFGALFITRILLGGTSVLRALPGIAILSLASAFIPSIVGYAGKRIFFIVYTISVIVGLIYAFYAIIADIAPGWEDLSSIIGYLFIVAIGFIIAVNAELINIFIHYRRNKKAD